MSFASNARAEMARELCTDACCSRAELAAALLASGGISYRFGSDPSYALSVTTAEAAVVRHVTADAVQLDPVVVAPFLAVPMLLGLLIVLMMPKPKKRK